MESGGAGFRFDPSQINRSQAQPGPAAPWVYDCDPESVTVEWESQSGALAFQLDWRLAGSANWTTASDKLKGCQVRKKKLEPSKGYEFRVRVKSGAPAEWGSWSSVSEPMRVMGAQEPRIAPPLLLSVDVESITVQWQAVPDVLNYELQWREEAPGTSWITASSSLKSTATRKKNLEQGKGYLFRVKPQLGDGWGLFSPPSAAMRPGKGVSAELVSLIGETTVVPGGQFVPTSASLCGSGLVALYFSAHWCPPCRQFTPQLAAFYKQIRATGRPFEVVFVSRDKDEKSFIEYHQTMPWKAIPFTQGAAQRDAAAARFGVSGIPALVVLGPEGQIVSQNGIQDGLTTLSVDQWLRKIEK